MTTIRYKGVRISQNYQATSATGDDSYSVAVPLVSHNVTIEEIMSYENESLVLKISGHLKVSTRKARSIFKDLKIFLWVAGKSAVSLTPPPLIDEGWHCFILFTRDYLSFCQSNFGDYLHHEPVKIGTKVLPGIAEAKATIDHIIKHFPKLSNNWSYVPLSLAV